MRGTEPEVHYRADDERDLGELIGEQRDARGQRLQVMRALFIAGVALLLCFPASAQNYGPGDCPFNASSCVVTATSPGETHTLAVWFASLRNASGLAGAKTLALLGDSVMSQSDEANAQTGPCPFSSTNCFAYGTGVATWVNYYTGSRLSRPPGSANFGYTGQTSAEILARIGTVLAGNYDVVLLDGGFNDLPAGRSCAAIWANFLSMYQQFAAAGTVVIKIGIYPKSGGAAYTTAQTAVALCVNLQDRTYAATAGVKNYYFVNLDPIMTDPTQATWTAKSGVLQPDGAHPSYVGSSAIGWAIAQVINQSIPSWQFPTFTASDIWDATNNNLGNLLPNGVMAGTGGTAGTGTSGTIATSAVLDGTNAGSATVVGAKETNSDSTNAQVITLSGTYTGTNAYVTLSETVGSPSGKFTAGDVVQGRAWLRLGANTNIAYVNTQLGATDNGVGVNYATGGGANDEPAPTAGFASGNYVPISTPCRTLTGTVTGMSLAVNIELVSNVSPASVAGVVEVAGMEIRKGCQ